MMPKFRKKSVAIEARQWTGDNFQELYNWGLPDSINSYAKIVWAGPPHSESKCLSIETLEGEMIASLGDWIIKGVEGEFYPCKPDIFEATYDPVEGVDLSP